MSRIFLFLPMTAFLLSGCDMRNTLGLDHYQPNEFNVSDNPPLSVPKDYKLRPPKDGATQTPAGQTSSEAAQAALGVKKEEAVTSTSEKTLVDQAAKGQTPDPSIRETVNKEAAVDASLSDKVTEKMASWKDEFKTNVNSINTDQKTDQKVDANQKVDTGP